MKMLQKEYVLKISSRDIDRPLAETFILEFGFNAENKKGLAEGVGQLAELIRMFGSPEKVAKYIHKNSVIFGQAKTLIGRIT